MLLVNLGQYCVECIMGLFWDTTASLIGYYEVAQENRSKIRPPIWPTVQFDTRLT